MPKRLLRGMAVPPRDPANPPGEPRPPAPPCDELRPPEAPTVALRIVQDRRGADFAAGHVTVADAGTLYWGRAKSVWNQARDTATLRDPTGEIVATGSYGTDEPAK